MNINFSESKIETFAVHKVGNKSTNESCILSKSNVIVNKELEELLSRYFVSSFKFHETFNFYHDIDINMNEVYSCASSIFDNPDSLLEQSINLAKHLYEQSVHPQIKVGEFYVVYFKDCIVDGEKVEAVGLFKSENKDTFLKVYPSADGFEIKSDKGININKLDKGCLIFNTEIKNGYIVVVVDNTNKGVEAHYWMDDFLHVCQRKDEYYNTQNILSLTKQFIKEEMPQQFDISRTEQIDLLNKSVKFFKEKNNFDIEEFTNEVMEKPEIISTFNRYKNDYANDYDLEFTDTFPISDNAVKRQARIFKSVIKLDKNFHIYVHGDRSLIEQGEDNKGKFYKVYYKEEN